MIYYGYVDDSYIELEEQELGEALREQDILDVLKDYADWDKDPLAIYKDDPLKGADRLLAELLKNAGSAGIIEFYIEDETGPRVIEDDEDRIQFVSKVFQMQESEVHWRIIIARLLFRHQIPELLVRRFCHDYFRPGTDYRKHFC